MFNIEQFHNHQPADKEALRRLERKIDRIGLIVEHLLSIAEPDISKMEGVLKRADALTTSINETLKSAAAPAAAGSP